MSMWPVNLVRVALEVAPCCVASTEDLLGPVSSPEFVAVACDEVCALAWWDRGVASPDDELRGLVHVEGL